VDVVASGEGPDEDRVLREVREDARLDLVVVGREEERAGLRHEGFADADPPFSLDRDVLEVRLGGGEATRRRDRLVQGRMQASGLGTHEQRQRVHIGGL